MSSNLKTNWKKALDIFLEKCYTSLKKDDIDWVMIGSVATYYQNCEIKPKDIDILVKVPKSVHFISNLLCIPRQELY